MYLTTLEAGSASVAINLGGLGPLRQVRSSLYLMVWRVAGGSAHRIRESRTEDQGDLELAHLSNKKGGKEPLGCIGHLLCCFSSLSHPVATAREASVG